MFCRRTIPRTSYPARSNARITPSRPAPALLSICSCPRSRRHFRLRGRRPRSACYHLRLHAETSGHKMDLYTSCRCRPAVQGTHKLPTPTPMPTLAVIHASAPSRPAMNLCTNADVDAPPRGRTRYTR
jgi:hypothetical protein